jgi:UDP-N-acetylmuramate dehydrogenase
MEWIRDASLKPYHTFGTDVKAALFAEAQHRDEITDFVRNVYPTLDKPLLILGGGSNMLFTEDFPGAVLKISTKGIYTRNDQSPYVIVTAEAGENWESFVDHTLALGLGGLENLALIPGQAGSCPIQNIGAYGTEIKDCFHSLEAIELKTGLIREFSAKDCKFGYRDSVFKNELKGQYIILSVSFRLSEEPQLNTSYGAISGELQKMNISNPGIGDVAQAVTNIRRSKLPDPKELGNAGSFFKNPSITAFDYYRLKNEFPDLPAHNQNNGFYKLAAAWLIEQCGWKGRRSGDAGVHEHQALILVNYGKASGAEIYKLSEEIILSVQQKFGVRLEREVNIF